MKPQTVGIQVSTFLAYMSKKGSQTGQFSPFEELLSSMSKTGVANSSTTSATATATTTSASSSSSKSKVYDPLPASQTPAVLFEQAVAASGTPAKRVEIAGSDRARLETLLTKSGYKEEDAKQILDQATTTDGNINLGVMFQTMHRYLPQDGPSFYLNAEDKPLLIQTLKGLGVSEEDVNQYVEGLEVSGGRLLVTGLPSLLAKADSTGQSVDKGVLTDLLGKLGLSQSEIETLLSKGTDAQDQINARAVLAMLQKAANAQDGEVASYLKDLAQRVRIGGSQGDQSSDAAQLRAKFIQVFQQIEASVEEQGLTLKEALSAVLKSTNAESSTQETAMHMVKANAHAGQTAEAVQSGSDAAYAGLEQGLGQGQEARDQGAQGQTRQTGAQAEGTTSATGGLTRLGEAMPETASGPRGALPAQVVRQVAQQMVQMVAKQQTTLQLGLKPPSLGELNLELSVKDGVVKAQMVVESVAAKQALEAGMEQLKSQLAGQGLKLDQVEITINPDAQRQQAQAQAQDQSGSGNGSSRRGGAGQLGGSAANEDEEAAIAAQSLGLSGSISVFA